MRLTSCTQRQFPLLEGEQYMLKLLGFNYLIQPGHSTAIIVLDQK